MSCNAQWARSKNGVATIQSSLRGASAARLAFVTWHLHVVEIGTAGALQQVTSHGCHVSKLSRGTGKDCTRKQWVSLGNSWVVGDICIGDQSSHSETTIGLFRYVMEWKPVDVDDDCRRRYVILH